MKDLVRHGDLLIIPIAETEFSELKKHAELDKTGVVLAGEATGHHHRVDNLEAAELYRLKFGHAEAVMSVTENGVGLIHEEHARVTLEPGYYKVHRAREFDYAAAAARFVVD